VSQGQHQRGKVQNPGGADEASGRLKVGDEVVDPLDKYDGTVGIIDEIIDDDDDYNVLVAFEGESEPYAFRRDELKVVGAAQTVMSSELSPKDAVLHRAPSSDDEDISRFKVGSKVQVVDHQDRFLGLVGVIDEITTEDHDYNVHVVLPGFWGRRAFRRDQLKVVGIDLQTAMRSKPKNTVLQQSNADIPRNSPQAPRPTGTHRQGLSRGAKIGLAVAVGIVLLIIASIVIAISAKPSHSQRYENCKATIENEGYKGDALKQAIQFCVDYQ
jgi:hypothetical protein